MIRAKQWLGALCICAVLSITLITCSSNPEPYVNEVDQARDMLDEQRSEVRSELDEEVTPENIEQLIELGLWTEAETHLDSIDENNTEYRLIRAQLLFKQHRYEDAERIVNEVLQSNPGSRKAQLLQAELDIQAWQLEEADQLAAELLQENDRDAEVGMIRGRVALLNRNYDEALQWANRLQEWDSEFAGGYLLEAESRFWSQDPAGAEGPLIRAIELNPFNPDARFSYGYAIWRRVDATQLDDMAAQWNLAFELNPLHYLTHWHFGNGHTNLTYANYAHPTDSLVRPRLDEADALISEDRLDEAIDITREVESEYPESVLPAMMRGSIYYMYYDMDRATRLDSAQTIFRSILEKKQNYGPAHNGLAAVIKQRQFEQLDGFKELKERVEETEIPEEGSVFYNIFEDANYYPGDRVKKMIAQQIGPSKAYLPMINKFDSDFAIPPLHIDLAEAMESNYFRYGTTFDNRQWMDIRGVGSGATGIEYLERGAHWERNVLAHEYAHLYHGRILTDKESRRIRSLYHKAMKNNRTLDYYASNNESEFFAQGYAGFLSEKKVHPLNHKSMNTRQYIKDKDPAYYTFLDSLLQKQQEYLSGNEEVMADNWAQTYLSLAERAGNSDDLNTAVAYLDTALTHSADYMPAILEYAEVDATQGEFDTAEDKIARVKELDEEYAPIYVTKANVIHEEAVQGRLSFDKAIEEQIVFLEKAETLETDLAERARLNRLYRERNKSYGNWAESIEVAEGYVEEAPTISTYLRDRKEEAETFAKYMRSLLGYSEQMTDYFETLIDQNPQNFEYLLRYAEVLTLADEPDQAQEVLREGQRILSAADNERVDYTLHIAKIHAENGQNAEAEDLIDSINRQELGFAEKLLLAEVYAGLDRVSDGKEVLDQVEDLTLPEERGDFEYVKAVMADVDNNVDEAVSSYRQALDYNPYHLKARAALVNLMNERGDEEASNRLMDEADKLSIPLGPDFNRLTS